MGCDIHAYVETREEPILDAVPERFRTTDVVSLIDNAMRTRDFSSLRLVADSLEEAGLYDVSIFTPLREETWRANGSWAVHDWMEKYRDGFYDEERTEPKTDWKRAFEDPLYIGRHYDLFAILADVRNGRGFAGDETGGGFVPIAQPRGLPTDATLVARTESDRWGVDGHSHSHLTVAEMLAYDWGQTTSHWGWVNAEEYGEFKSEGKPSGWCGGVGGGGTRHLTNEQMEERIKSGRTDSCYTLVEWTETYGESVRGFLDTTLPALASLTVDPSNVRLVFWFDN